MQIKPLFLSAATDSEHMGQAINHLASNNATDKKSGARVLINAKTDAEAIAAFLQSYKDSPETIKVYAKELERLLLWCIHIAKMSISDLRCEDLTAYQKFMKKPEPKKTWCGPIAPRRTKDLSLNSAWRPFVKGLGESSIKRAVNIINAFFNYLVQTNYLTGNPLAIEKKRKRRSKPKLIDRYLELDEINAVIDALNAYPIQNRNIEFRVARAKYIVLLLFYTGLRISEASNHRMGNFLQREGNWFLRVKGKGNKTREIPVPHALLQATEVFRVAVGLPSSEPKFRERAPLIPMGNLKQPISARRVDQIIRWAFGLGANKIEPEHPRKASKLRSASAHWLRHSYVTYLLDSGAPLKVAQENAGHSDIGTTMHYCHVAQTDRFAATCALSLNTDKEKEK